MHLLNDGRRIEWRVVALLAVATVALRAQTFGNPVLGFDEQFYLVMADRMLHGALPYVDIFDRKPIGLFLLYAGSRLLGGEGTIEYQAMAALFAFATALVIYRLSTRIAPPSGAILAALLYLVWLDFMGGEGGQAPVLFDLPMAIAALLTARALASGGRNLFGLGAGAMLAAGLAIQIKYTVAFEGIFFGCTLLWTGRRAGLTPLRLVPHALGWVAIALAPTVAAFVTYVALGHGPEFVFANFASIFGRLPDPLTVDLVGIAKIAAVLSPLLALAALPPREADDNAALQRRFVQIWLGVAIASMLAMRSFASSQYGLPLLAPAVIAAAPRLGTKGWGRLAGWTIIVLGMAISQIALTQQRIQKGGRAAALAVAAAAAPHRGCLYVYDGYPALYRLTHSCLLTRFIFPGHLNTANEASIEALGVDPNAEVERIMKAGPETVVDDWPRYAGGNPATHAILQGYLERDYHLVLRFATGHGRLRLVYRRNASAGPPATMPTAK